MYNVPSEASRLDPRGAESVIPVGPLAQLGERRVRNAEVEGSNPLRSTILFHALVFRSALNSAQVRLPRRSVAGEWTLL